MFVHQVNDQIRIQQLYDKLIIQTKLQMELSQSFQIGHLEFSLQQLTKSKKTHYRQFTYNDSEALKTSMRQLWTQVYQYPQHQPLSNRYKTEKSEMQSEQHSVQNARSAWSIYDPEKEQVFEFDVFKAAKNKTQTASKLEKQPHQKKASGWGNVFKKQSWGQLYEKPPPFMGAFEHVQPDFGANINISIPSRFQYSPYSQYLQNSRSESIVSPYNNLQYSKILGSQLRQNKKEKQDNKNRYFFECEQVQSVCQPSQAKMQDIEMKQSKIQHMDQQLSHSMVWNYESLFGELKPFKSADPEWQSVQNKPIGKITNSQIFEVHKQSNSKVFESFQLQLNLSYDVDSVLSDHFILTQISKMLQNVQCELFTLDYTTLTWKLDVVAFRPQYIFRSSLAHVLEGVLEIASQRSRLSAAVNFLNKNKYRKIYSELSVHIAQMLIVFEQIILELVKQCTLVQFLSQIQKIKLQIELLYNLIINEDYINQENKLYEDFDFRFLHAEALIFKRIVKLARNADAVLLQNNNLVNQLLQAAFSPLLFLLQNLLFSQCPYLELNSQLYLKYYFEQPKQIINSVSKKLELIKQQSNEMYLICKVKEKLSLVQTLRELKRYEQRWQKSFKLKRKLIDRIKKQHKNKLKWDQQKKKEQKMKDILELKSRFFQTQQQEWTRKRNIAEKNKDQLQRLKKQIEQKQERRKLMEQLQKEKEKSILLDIELKEKQKLAKEKQGLLRKLSNLQMKSQQLKAPSKQSLNLQSQSVISDKQPNQKELKLNSQINIKQQEKLVTIQMKKQASLNIQKPVQKIQAFSEEIIPSQKSIQQLNRKYMQTAGGFFTKKQKQVGNKTESYFQLVQKPKGTPLELQSQSNSEQQQSQLSQIEEEQENNQVQIQSEDEENFSLQDRQVDIQTCINICVDEVVKKQSQVVRKCLEFIIVDKYQIMQILQYLRTIFMSGNGQKVQEFIRLCITNEGLVGLKHFTDCLLFDTPLQNIQKLNPTFYHSKTNTRHAQINIFSDSIEHYIGFEFNNLPNILEPYFSYIHLSKYMQIFGFIVRLRHCSNLLSQSWKLLNSYKKQLDRKEMYGKKVDVEHKLMNSLCMVRYRISSFLKMFENYLFFRVIEKEYKNMRANITELNHLQLNHVKMLDNIIKYGFIDNANQTISKNFRQLLVYINEFYQVVNKLVLDDIASYEIQEVQQKINFLNVTFNKQLRNMDRKLFKLSDS